MLTLELLRNISKKPNHSSEIGNYDINNCDLITKPYTMLV